MIYVVVVLLILQIFLTIYTYTVLHNMVQGLYRIEESSLRNASIE